MELYVSYISDNITIPQPIDLLGGSLRANRWKGPFDRK